MNTQDWLDRWNQRYRGEGYAFGTDPNVYLKEQLSQFPIGSILFPAEGEGRNAVYAAQLGWEVSAFDISDVGRDKAIQLATDRGVTIRYDVGELDALHYGVNQFDVIALIYAHFPAAIKSAYHRQLSTYLKPGGMVIFEAFSKNHLAYKQKNERVGGPSDIASLFSIEEIQADFSGYKALQLEETVIELHEGTYHEGVGSVIRFTGQKM